MSGSGKPVKKPKQKKEKKVRKPNPIDWSLVENLLQADCSGTEIASYMGISNDTLYERTKKEKGMNFSLYSLKFKSNLCIVSFLLSFAL